MLKINRIYQYFFIILFAAVVYPQNLNDALRLSEPGLGIGARALGLGNSYVGISDDASAIYFNPAGLGLLKRMEFSGGIDYYSFKNNTTFLGNASNSSTSQTQLDQLSFVFPFPTYRGSLVFGLTYNSIKDFSSSVKFDAYNGGSTSMIQNLLNTDVPFDLYLTDNSGNTVINGRLNQSGSILSSGNINHWGLSGAVEIYKNLFIGGTFNILSGNYKNTNEYYEDDYKGNYTADTLATGYAFSKGFQTFYLSRITDWELSGWDFKLGFLYQIKEIARFGMTLQFPKSYTVKEDFTVDGSSDFPTKSVSLDKSKYSDHVEYDVTTPYSLDLGASVNFKGLILSGQVTLKDYTQMEFQNGDGISAQDISSVNQKIKDNLRATASFNFGAEYTIPEVDLRIRGGYIKLQSPYLDDPSDFDKKYITGGLGILADETIAIDIAYAYGWWKTYGDNYGTNVSRTYQDIKVNKLLLGFTYRF